METRDFRIKRKTRSDEQPGSSEKHALKLRKAEGRLLTVYLALDIIFIINCCLVMEKIINWNMLYGKGKKYLLGM